MVEQVTLNHWVHGSSPCTPTIFQEAGSSRPFLFLLFPPLHEETVAQAWANAVWGKREGAQRRDSCRKEGALRRAHVRAPSRAPLSCANIPFKRPKREADGLTPVALRAKRPLIAPSRPSLSRLKERRGLGHPNQPIRRFRRCRTAPAGRRMGLHLLWHLQPAKLPHWQSSVR